MTSYTYDNVSRLASLAHAFADTTKNLTLGFSYNAASQIDQATRSNDLYSWTGHGTGSTSSSADGLNRLSGVGSVTPTYDTKGNMTSDGRWTYSYDSENHMTGAAGRFYYDAVGHLAGAGSLSGSSPQIYYDWYGDQMLAEHLAGSATGRRHVFGPWTDEPLVWYEGSGTSDRRFTHADERGSIIAVTDSSGVVRNVNTYDEYGRVHDTNDYYFGRFEFTGQRYFSLDLYDYKNRLYHPGWGRFMQTDPIGYGGGMNMYNYVGGDPVNFTDPLGLKKDKALPPPPPPSTGEDPPITVTGQRPKCSKGWVCGSVDDLPTETPIFDPDWKTFGNGEPLPSAAEAIVISPEKKKVECILSAINKNKLSLALDLGATALTLLAPEGSAGVTVASAALGVVGIGNAIANKDAAGVGIAYAGRQAAVGGGFVVSGSNAARIVGRLNVGVLVASWLYDGSAVLADYNRCMRGR